MYDFLEEIARHKTISAHFLEEIARHKTFSAHFLRKSPATNFFISSGNRSPQNFFGSFPQEIARHKLFQLISLGNRSPRTSSFPQEIACQELLHFLRKSACQELLHFLEEIVGWPTSNSRYRRGGQVFLSVKNNPRF